MKKLSAELYAGQIEIDPLLEIVKYNGQEINQSDFEVLCMQSGHF